MAALVPSAAPPGRRLLGEDGTPEFSSHCGTWIILAPARIWEQWRELAQAVLATGDPRLGELAAVR